MFEESTGTQMAHHMHTTLMITSDREKVRLEALIKEQDHAINEAVRQVQERHLEEMQAIVDAILRREDESASPKCHSDSREDDVKRMREESQRLAPCPRGKDVACTVSPSQTSNHRLPQV